MVIIVSVKSLKKIFEHIGWATFEQAILSATNLIIAFFLIKIWPLEVFGQFSITYLFIVLTLEIQRACIISPMMSLAPKKSQSEQAMYFSTLNRLNIALSLISALLMAFVTWLSGWFAPQWRIASLFLIMGGFVIPRMIHEFLRCQFFVQKKPLKALVMSSVRSGLLMLLLVLGYFYWGDLTLKNTLLIYIFSYIISSAVAYVTVEKKSESGIHVYKKTVVDHWYFGRWLFVTVGVQYATNNYLLLIAATILGPVAVGAIRAVQHIMGVLGTIFQALENIVPAHSAALFHRGGLRALSTYLMKTSIGLLITSLIFFIGVFIFQPLIISFFFADEDKRMISMLIYAFMVFYMLLSPSLCLVYALRAIEKTRPIFIAYAITALLNTVFARWIIDQLGLMGLVYAMIFFQMVIISVYALFLKKYYQMGHK